MHAEIAISARDSSFCAKSARYNIFTNGAPYERLTTAQKTAFIVRKKPASTDEKPQNANNVF